MPISGTEPRWWRKRAHRAVAFDQIGDAVRDLGIVNGVLALTARLIRRVSARRARLIKYYLLAQPILRNAEMPSQSSRIEVFLIRPDDAITSEFPRPSAVIARRFSDGALCLVARSRGKFAGFLWLSLRPYEEDEVRCTYVTLP